MKPKLLILSDLWGKQTSQWTDHYITLLSPLFNITYYDCCELGGIHVHPYQQEQLHQQFVTGGIDRAVQQLLQFEKEKVSLLAFSIGGTIAWKAALQGLDVKQLIAVSSTRLRYETQQPNCPIKLYFGDQDQYLPSINWFDEMRLSATFIPKHGHECYREAIIAQQICQDIQKLP